MRNPKSEIQRRQVLSRLNGDNRLTGGIGLFGQLLLRHLTRKKTERADIVGDLKFFFTHA